ncbi:MAG TPA: hypothetical protein VNP72_02270, partial [Longimicrobium sp.]|nr:hypothetical protein [Longimicrobium sp.]
MIKRFTAPLLLALALMAGCGRNTVLPEPQPQPQPPLPPPEQPLQEDGFDGSSLDQYTGYSLGSGATWTIQNSTLFGTGP